MVMMMSSFCRGNPSKYGLIEKVIDGMTLEVRSVLVYLKDPSFQAYLEMTDILLQSTSPEWTRVPLSKARYVEHAYIDAYTILKWEECLDVIHAHLEQRNSGFCLQDVQYDITSVPPSHIWPLPLLTHPILL